MRPYKQGEISVFLMPAVPFSSHDSRGNTGRQRKGGWSGPMEERREHIAKLEWREIREKKEQALSPYAARSIHSLGRDSYEPQCPIRTVFERDGNRILHSPEFRRLKHKTQVFFNAKNDHICTRMEHVLTVASISTTIARTLGLNQDLVYAISLGHDLGHAPFGHTGEKVIHSCLQQINPKYEFQHERHSLRVVDFLATRISSSTDEPLRGLNLSFEVRDGIVSHCGELFGEYQLHRNPLKTPETLYHTNHREAFPYTLEGCIVRLVDKIAYVGRDLEDARRAGIITMWDISKDASNVLGNSNSQIINTLVMDIVEHSYEQDRIQLSEEKGQALKELLSANNAYIYNSDKIKRYEKNTMNILEGIFESLYNATEDIEKMQNSKVNVLRNFHSYIQQMNYERTETREQMVVDYVAGMTDNYAMKCYEELYWF